LDIYNAWLALFEIFDLQRGLALTLDKPGRRRNNEFLNIRLVRTYKRAGCWRPIYYENCVFIRLYVLTIRWSCHCSSSYYHCARTSGIKTNTYFHE